MEMIFCTVTTNRYVFLAKVMAKSIKDTNPNAKVLMCLVEEDLSYVIPRLKTNYFDHIVLAKDIGVPNFYKHMFLNHPDMATVSFKGRLLQYALNKYPDENKFVYLDSDFKVYGPFEEIHSLLDKHPIILTPHLVEQVGQDFEPYPIMRTQHEVFPEEMEFLSNKNGIYNSGMLAIRRTDESIRFINWWCSKIERMSEVEDKRIIYGDQRWLDQAPVLFNAYVIRHPGYNAAWWNHHERELSISNGGNYTVNGLPLRCFHFSMTLHLKRKYPEFLKVRFTDPNDLIHHLLMQYLDDLIQAGQDFDDDDVPATYSIYHRPFSKEWISMTSRELYRINQDKFKHIENPFILSNAVFETWLMTGDSHNSAASKAIQEGINRWLMPDAEE